MLAALALLGSTACEDSRTEILVVVDTDLMVPREINGLEATVTNPDGDTFTSMATLGGDNPPLPRTLGILWKGGALEPVSIHVAGQIGGVDVVERSARTGFIKHKTLVLLMELTADCQTVRCGADQTCVDGTCRPDFLDPATLPEWTGQVPGADAGVRPDAGDDAATDSGVDSAIDSAVDGGDCTDEVCNGLDDDCDMMIDEDFDLMTDVDNCGRCGNACSFMNGMADCVDGACVLTGCDMDFGDCDMDPMTGCETDLLHTTDHCGTCDTACSPPDRDCCDGTCGRCL